MNLQSWRIKLVADLLHRGAVIAYPTEGVWGLGCLPDNEYAVARILAMKNRSWEQGLILAAGVMDQVTPYLDAVTPQEQNVLAAAWPGPVTFIVPGGDAAPVWIRGSHDGVALRVSAHPVIAAICAELGAPIVSTSANPSGRAPARNALRVRQYFGDAVDYIVPGELGDSSSATEIRVLRSGRVLRAGKAGADS